MAATTGTGQFATELTDAWRRRTSDRADRALAADDCGVPSPGPGAPVRPAMATRSSPTEKWGPRAAITTARISASEPMAVMARGRSVQNAGPMAFRFSGRSSQSVATWPSASMERTSEENEWMGVSGGGAIARA